MNRVPDLYFDGQFIDVKWDNVNEVVDWFKTHFNWHISTNEKWTVDPRCTEGKMIQMDLGTWIISYIANESLPHHKADRAKLSHVKLCFRIKNIANLHQHFLEKDIRVSNIYNGPKTQYFDVFITNDNIRLTIQEDNTINSDEILPSWIRIGVNNLEKSRLWYETYMDMKLVEQCDKEKYAIMSLKLNHSNDLSYWVIEQENNSYEPAPIHDQVQPYCWINNREDFFTYHQYLQSENIQVSEIGGYQTAGMVSFHFFDNDGNRINISSM